ncbi:40S ribosomal protein S21 [Theileria orientalis]|uniref:40S ribosomal protein S21 n=2 Tax=Theileria orientalis TaxID=68886 RepID=J4DA89_THEOR|nr:40S ribosomal protein S21 [Theileria orientalis strain Shintoku]PVC49659.1 40S ribosomal protein S21 [Theileria orientalis]UVC50117.1 40S ribosomal protein S21 [Theileria orientalis]UVC54421.1 40S ribosomal protein S21 [Theileria orientalis]BAM41810.1 40S ribosomal protein S21 [Theileria orientalis strain Shintoku]|eukprot:XP_009692111.1 40S ribosomal protein S21 [Theileria orientalis strain Shintoku]
MINEDGKLVDLYIPRKCSGTNRILSAKDHGAVQINIGLVDEMGVYTNSNYTLALSPEMRQRGDADEVVNRLLRDEGLMQPNN